MMKMLILTMLHTNSSRQHFEIFFLENKLSLNEPVCMKCQTLFSEKYKKTFLK